ncbi:MAG: hypothetical protein Q9218_005709 [Villophora microphyllina]
MGSQGSAERAHYNPSNLWRLLPVEIRIEVYKNIADLPTLRNLIAASPPDQAIYRTYSRKFCGVHRTGSKQLSTWIGETIGCRNYESPAYDQFADSLQEYIARNCWPSLETYYATDAVAYLFFAAETTESIEGWVQSFGRKRILLTSSQPTGQLSKTELYRIRRAFWRVCGIIEWRELEAARSYEPKQQSTRNARFVSTYDRSETDSGEQWFCRNDGTNYRSSALKRPPTLSPGCSDLTDWELKELDAIRGFLRDEINSVQVEQESSPNILHSQPLLIQRLVKELENPTLGERYSLANFLTMGIAECPPNSWDNTLNNSKPPELQASLEAGEARMVYRQQESLCRTVNWGWSIWDRPRLVQCGILLPRQFPQGNIQITGLLKKRRDQHKQTVRRLKDTKDIRVRSRFKADVQEVKLQLKRKETMQWAKTGRPALYRVWLTLVQSESPSQKALRVANRCFEKALQLREEAEKVRQT